MDNSVIAVQIADGSFVPVLDTAMQKRRRLVVTTVRDNQTDVRVELFRGSDESMADAEYIGSLLIQEIEPGPAGEADISVLTGVDATGNLNVTATNAKSGQYESLSVSLEELASSGEAALGDFEISGSSSDELEDISLDDLSLDDDDLSLDDAAPSLDTSEDDNDFSLDDLSLDEEELLFDDESPTAAVSPEGDAEPEDVSLEPLEESPEDAVSLAEDEDEEAEEDDGLQLDDDLSLDDLDLSLDGPDSGDESHDASLEELSTELSAESSDEFTLDDLSFDEETEDDNADALATFSDESFALDESLSFDESESLEETPFETEAPDEPGMEEADLGEEDFTFDDTMEDEPLFAADESAAEDKNADLAAVGGHQESLDDTLSADEFDRLDSRPEPDEEVRDEQSEEQPLTPRRSNGLIFAGYIVLALAAVGVLTYVVFRLLEGPPAPPLRASLLRGFAFFGFVRPGRRRGPDSPL